MSNLSGRIKRAEQAAAAQSGVEVVVLVDRPGGETYEACGREFSSRAERSAWVEMVRPQILVYITSLWRPN